MSGADNYDQETRIRQPAAADISTVVEMIYEHAKYEKCPLKKDPLLSTRLAGAVLGLAPRVHMLVAQIGSELVGYCACTIEYSTWRAEEYLHLDCLYIRENWRSRGIGALLLRSAIGLARGNGIKQLQWQTPAWNSRAIAFYGRQGAISHSKQRFVLEV